MIPPFERHRPSTVEEASECLLRLGDAAFYAGGTELLQLMKIGLARFSHLIDLKGVAELAGIHLRADGALRIGSTVTHRELEGSEDARRAHPALAELERHVANRRVREMGTIGGNLCFAEPHSDPATYLVATGATLELAAGAARRHVAVEAFLQGALTTDRSDEEVLVAVHVPSLPPRTGTAYRKLSLAERPTAAAACLVSLDPEGAVESARVVVGSVGEVPEVIEGADGALRGATSRTLSGAAGEAGRVAERAVEADDDPVTSAAYRRHLAGVLVRRAAQAAFQQAGARVG